MSGATVEKLCLGWICSFSEISGHSVGEILVWCGIGPGMAAAIRNVEFEPVDNHET